MTSWSVRNPLGLALPIGIVELNRFVGTYAVTRISVNARRFTCSSCAGQEVLARSSVPLSVANNRFGVDLFVVR